MTLFGLNTSEVTPLVQAVVDRDRELDLDDAEVAEQFARATWTGIAEPGDRVAGIVIDSLGATEALTAIVEHWSVERLEAALVEAGAEHVFNGTEGELSRALERWQPRLLSGAALLALRQAARFGVRLLTPEHALWPRGLDDLQEHAPIALWIRGTDAALASLSRSIALVGARAATGYGEHVTMEASAGLVDRGYAIVSGAAYGIDGMAHRAALASQGQTVAFLAGGVDRFYPSGHDALLTRIAEAGAVISELPCGSPPTKWRFLQRNRLIAATSLATIVLEAGWRSGSLNTAGHAATLGRPLGAVPGPVTSAASAGCHRLIRDFGAVLVTNPDEMAELAPLDRDEALVSEPVETGEPGPLVVEPVETGGSARATSAPLSAGDRESAQTRVLDALSIRSPRAADDVARRSGLSLAETQAVLGMLELDGAAKERERGWVKASAARVAAGQIGQGQGQRQR